MAFLSGLLFVVLALTLLLLLKSFGINQEYQRGCSSGWAASAKRRDPDGTG